MLDTMTVEMVETNAITFNAARGFLARDCTKATLDDAGTGSCTPCLHLQGHLCLRQRAAVAGSAGSFDENVQSQDAWLNFSFELHQVQEQFPERSVPAT